MYISFLNICRVSQLSNLEIYIFLSDFFCNFTKWSVLTHNLAVASLFKNGDLLVVVGQIIVILTLYGMYWSVKMCD